MEAASDKYVTELGPHDVLLGRGTGPNNNQGNVEFRIAVEKSREAYVSTASRKAKSRIVTKTVQDVKSKEGRFLKKLMRSQIKLLKLPHKEVYEVATDDIAVEKTKQALRYVCYKKEPSSQKKEKRVECAESKTTLEEPSSPKDEIKEPRKRVMPYSITPSMSPPLAPPAASLNDYLPSFLSSGLAPPLPLSSFLPLSSESVFAVANRAAAVNALLGLPIHHEQQGVLGIPLRNQLATAVDLASASSWQDEYIRSILLRQEQYSRHGWFPSVKSQF
jgi:hypothetical protein